MPSPNTAARVEIKTLTLLQYFMLCYIGRNRKRAQPVYLPELRRACLPRPIEEAIDDLGHQGLTRPALNAQKQAIHHSVFVTEVGWNQIHTQRTRVLADARREVNSIRVRASSTRKPEDSNRKPDPNGADDFDKRANDLERFISYVEATSEDALNNSPIPTSERRKLMGGDGYDVESGALSNEELSIDPAVTQVDDADDAADPKLMGRVRVSDTGGGEGLGDLTDQEATTEDDATGEKEERPPAPRTRKRKAGK